MAKTILITGGSSLLALGWAVSTRFQLNVVLGFHNRKVELHGTKGLVVNLNSVESICRTIENIRPDLVIHTAALTNIEICERKPELAYHVNVNLSVNIAKACHQYGIQLVLISSDHVFSGKSSMVDETETPCPLNNYALTKVKAEQLVMDIHSDSLVVRTNFYGWGTSYRRSFSDLILEHLTKREGIVLFDNVYYTPILIQSLAEAVHELIDIQAKGIINVVGDEKISKFEFGLKLAKQFNLNAKFICPGLLEDKTSLVQRPHDMSLSNNKIIGLLGRGFGTVDEGIALLYQQKKNCLDQELQQL